MTPEEDFKLTPDMAIANLQELKHYVDNDSKQAINLAIKALRGYYSTRLCPIANVYCQRDVIDEEEDE